MVFDDDWHAMERPAVNAFSHLRISRARSFHCLLVHTKDE
jgi:hypothetical protein